jgi:Inner membrane protein YgaP-like, transmembrane domain
MSPNMSTLDRGLRALAGFAAIGAAVAIGAGSVGGIVLFAFAAVLLATGAVGFCPLYRLIRFDGHGQRPLPH